MSDRCYTARRLQLDVIQPDTVQCQIGAVWLDTSDWTLYNQTR